MPGRKVLIVGNWKMNGAVATAAKLVRDIGRQASGVEAVEVAVCPPFVYLPAAFDVAIRGSLNIKLGGQDSSQHDSGAHTGDISAAMLMDFGCTYSIVGHSERRQHHGETDELVALKAVAAQRNGLKPIVCVGETLTERNGGCARDVVLRQLDAIFATDSAVKMSNMVVAYEPVWAIGTGNTATVEQVQEVHGWLRERLRVADAQASENCRILYGGSVNGDNVANLLALPDVDGCLVGGASLQADGFARIFLTAEQLDGR